MLDRLNTLPYVHVGGAWHGVVLTQHTASLRRPVGIAKLRHGFFPAIGSSPKPRLCAYEARVLHCTTA